MDNAQCDDEELLKLDTVENNTFHENDKKVHTANHVSHFVPCYFFNFSALLKCKKLYFFMISLCQIRKTWKYTFQRFLGKMIAIQMMFMR